MVVRETGGQPLEGRPKLKARTPTKKGLLSSRTDPLAWSQHDAAGHESISQFSHYFVHLR